MSLQCANCGQKNLPDQAKFCYNCGAAIAPNDEATRYVSDTQTLDDDDEGTRFVSDTQTLNDDDEGTRFVSDTQTLDDDEGTRFVSDTETPDDDEGTRMVSETVVADDEESTPADAPSTPDIDLKSGFTLANRYRIEKTLGRGGFGAVYLAEDIKLRRRCVVKQMLIQGKSLKDLDIYRANFKREANLLAELNDPGHPNIPEIYDYFSTKNGNYLVMKFIEGRSLKDILDQTDKMPWREAVQYAIEVCSGLDYMHSKGNEPILHRDIKPANILLGDDGRVWLVDFGLAKAEAVESSSQDQAATKASGSLGYTPLEQWFGEATPASDIYALGATLHHLVTGVSPLEAYDGKFNLKLISDLHGQFTLIRKIDRKLPKGLEQIIRQAVAADPPERPTPHQFQRRLETLVSAGQATALFTFKNGKSAKTVPELVDLCEANRREAEEYLYNGDFERWFLLINRNDLAEAAAKAVKLGRSRANGLERFLKLVMPNLLLRRMGKVTRQLGLAAAQILLVTLAVLLFLLLASSYGLRWFAERSIASMPWDFNTVEVDTDNYYTEAFLTEKFNTVALFDQTEVQVYPANGFDVIGHWDNLPFDMAVTVPLSATLQLEDQRPHFYIRAINGIPLFVVGNNISAGINKGIDTAFENGPFDMTELQINEREIVFAVDESDDPNRPDYKHTMVVAPTPTPSPTPVSTTMVVVFNEASDDIILEIEGAHTWEIAVNSTQVIEIPAGEYNYKVQHKGAPEVVATGTKIWNPDKAYRLHIVSADNLN